MHTRVETYARGAFLQKTGKTGDARKKEESGVRASAKEIPRCREKRIMASREETKRRETARGIIEDRASLLSVSTQEIKKDH